MTRILPDAPWRHRSGLSGLLAALDVDQGHARYVGGAVRDGLLGLPVNDLDIATSLMPQDVVDRLKAAGIKAVPTGIEHGTITAVLPDGPVEITTLRRDVSTDGRRATIAYTDDWQQDAARRDFTFNALYADPLSGAISDYFGGVADLDARHLRFIGDASARIAEDHLRILRFYRFAARFGRGQLDADSHAAVIAARQSLKSLSRERIADELTKILALPDPRAIVAQMAADGIFAVMLPELDRDFATTLDRLIGNEVEAGVPVVAHRRLAALLPADPGAAEQVASRLRLSTRQRKYLAVIAGHRGDTARPVRQLAYSIGIEAARDVHLIAGDAAGARDLVGWEVPVLPIRGGDIVARGIAVGPEVARILKAVEAAWVAEDFPGSARIAELVDQKIGRTSD